MPLYAGRQAGKKTSKLLSILPKLSCKIVHARRPRIFLTSARRCPFSCKVILHLQDPCKILQDTTDKIQALKWFLFPDLSQREHSNLVQVKGHKYISFFHFPRIRAGKSVKQANKFELPNWGSVRWEGSSRTNLGQTSSPPVLCCTMQGVVWEVCAVTTFLTRRDVVSWQHLCTTCELEVSS